jgi:hypothetical protein
MAVFINGVTMMFVGTDIVFFASAFPTRRELWERCGSYFFVAGTAVTVMAMWGMALAA